MKKLITLLFLLFTVSVLYGQEPPLPPMGAKPEIKSLPMNVKEDIGATYGDFMLRGASIVTVTSTSYEVVGKDLVILYDIFVITASSATTGTITLANTAESTLFTIDVQALEASTDQLTRRIYPIPGTPARYSGGLKAKTSTANIDVYLSVID